MIRVLWAYWRQSLLQELEYGGHFGAQLVESGVSLSVSLAAMGVIFSHTRQLNGWSAAELLTVVGVYQLFGGWLQLMVQPSLELFMQEVRSGALDYLLLRPADAQFLVSVRKWQPWRGLDILAGLALVVLSALWRQQPPGPWEWLAFALALAAGAVIVYSFWLVLATLSFWFIRTENMLVIFQSVYEAGRYPVSLFPRWLRFCLTYLVPVAFAVTVPAQALTSRLDGQALGWCLAGAALAFLGARLFWLWGLRHYSGASA